MENTIRDFMIESYYSFVFVCARFPSQAVDGCNNLKTLDQPDRRFTEPF